MTRKEMDEYRRGHNYPGVFVSFEGGEGSGKDTQAEMLSQFLKEEGYKTSYGREPGTTPAGKAIRHVLQSPDIPELHPRTELLLFNAAGVQFMEELVVPSIKKGEIFVANRWRDSTMAYQGYGRGLDKNVIDFLTRFSGDGVYPDLTLLIDVDAELGLSKVTGHEFGAQLDKIEAAGLEFHKKINQGYREIAAKNPERFRVVPYIDGGRDQMQMIVRSYVQDFICKYNLFDTLRIH